MINIIESYLNFLNEKEWEENPKWEDHISLDLLKHLISQDGKTDIKTLALNRQSIQPTILDLIKNTGGDYMGRETTRNSDHGDYAGIEYILKQMPKNWREKVKKYVEKIAQRHNEE